jgi:predicted dehydrogenase/threonine dehydrogenase-like Zn-dependent dehydrogenase
MKQVLQNLRTGETIVAEVPVPTPQAGQALVRNAASLVSAGTERMLVEFAEKSLLGKARSRPDLARQVLDKARREGLLTTIEAAFNRLDQPMPLGYSSAGVIAALGEGMEGFKVGQRVACAGGGYAVHAEYVTVPRNLLVRIPEEVDFEAAAFTTLGAIALHGFRLSDAQLGEHVAVIGLGLLGLLAVGILRAAGCHVFGVDLDAQRVALAQQMGARAVLRQGAEELAVSFSGGRGCDAVLICADSASADPIELAGMIARDRARVVAVGAVDLDIPRKVYYEKELTFLNSRSYGPGRYDPAYEEAGRDYPIGYVRWTENRNLEAFVDLLAGKRMEVQPLITHRFPIDEAPQAYELITGKQKTPFLGVVLTYPQADQAPASLSPDLGAAAVTTVASRSDLEVPGPKLDVVRLGVLGAGNFANAVLLPALKSVSNVELVGIASARGMGAQHAKNKFGFAYASSDEAQIISDPRVNTVAVLTRHNLHARQVLAALAEGKHVFCEKPLAMSLAELEDIESALIGERGTDSGSKREGNVQNSSSFTPRSHLLMVGFNRRFAPLAVRLKAFIDDCAEPLAVYYRVNAGYIPLEHWVHDPEQGGGRLLGEGCHFVDFLTFLAGAPPIAVSARALPDGGRYREDNIVMTFTFPDGSLGTISYLANGDKSFPKERAEVFCGGRVAILDDYRTLETVLNCKRKVFRSPLRQDKGHAAEWQAFVVALLEGGPPPIPYEQIFGVTRATLAALKSVRSGKTIQIS